MTVYLYAEWSTGDVDFDLTVDEDPAGTPELVNVTSTNQRLVHYDVSSLLTGTDDTAGWLAARLTAVSLTDGDALTYQVTFSETTGFTITTATATSIELSFANAATRLALGFSGNRSAATSHVSDIRPYYLITAAQLGRSGVSDDYEQGLIAAEAESHDGMGYGVSIGTPATFVDFTLAAEAKAAVFKRSATASVPWTYQHLWEHCRLRYAIACRDTLASETSVHRLTAAGASFSQAHRERFGGADYDGLWSLNFKTRLIGRV